MNYLTILSNNQISQRRADEENRLYDYMPDIYKVIRLMCEDIWRSAFYVWGIVCLQHKENIIQ